MRIAVLKETRDGETRVGLSPDVTSRLIRLGHEVVIQRGAGTAAGFLDGAYETAGATLAPDAEDAAQRADVVVRVEITSPGDVQAVPEGAVLLGFLWPVSRPQVIRELQYRKVSAFAMDLVPRITRAQSMDALSSMSTVAGYRAALLGAQYLGKFFPMLMTAAGTIPPARVVVVGVGVAGLQAIATARRLGAVVEAYDIRAEAREQARSLGAESIEIDLEESGEGSGGYAKELSEAGKAQLAAKLAERIRVADCVITTALVPGRPAPKLIDTETVQAMRAGAVIIDLAAETGGNCELTTPGEVRIKHDVTIVGTLNLPATMATDASRMYAKNIEEIVRHLTPPPAEVDGTDTPATPAGVQLDWDDEITDGAFAVHAGEIRHAPTREAMGVEPPAEPAPAAVEEPDAPAATETAEPETAEPETGGAA